MPLLKAAAARVWEKLSWEERMRASKTMHK